MIRNRKVSDLRVGAWVILPSPWLNHPFLKNSFQIQSDEQIDKIARSGITEVMVDLDKSRFLMESDSVSHDARVSEHLAPLRSPDSSLLRQAIENPSLTSERKARAVYEHSLRLMELVLENPTAEYLAAGKEIIGRLVDLILSDDDTSLCLLRITSHDFLTYTHSVNVGITSVALAKRLYRNNNSHNMHELGAGFFLHDLGKTKVDPSIINKPERLNDQEMKRMRVHPYQGYKIMKNTNHLGKESSVIVMQHHEREDGTGYPHRLRGNEIHDYARICCIADVFDALTAERSYKRSLSSFEALQIMKRDMIGHFHKEIFEQFVLLYSV